MSGKQPEYIVVNQVRCNKCGDEPFSRTVHDFRYCKCGAIAVDGGQEYLRRVGSIFDTVELSYSIPVAAMKDAIQALKDSREEGKTDAGQVNAIIRALRKHDSIKAIGE